MKKTLVTILAVIYIAVSSGATVNIHYCMGKPMNWDLAQKQEPRCAKCGMKKSVHKGCCKDEQKKLQIGKDQKVSESVFQYSQSANDAGITIYPVSSVSLSSVAKKHFFAHAPPLTKEIPLFLLNCNFRI